VKYSVTIIESERGWGQRVDEILYFDKAEEAIKYTDDYNKQYNPPGPVPDWYMVAIYNGLVKEK
jgi:hypothetical protein